jgi:hypothetical protein
MSLFDNAHGCHPLVVIRGATLVAPSMAAARQDGFDSQGASLRPRCSCRAVSQGYSPLPLPSLFSKVLIKITLQKSLKSGTAFAHFWGEAKVFIK